MLKFKIKFEKPKYCFVGFSLVYRASSFCFTIPTLFPECHFSSNTGIAVGPVSHLTQTQDNASSQAHSSGFNCNLEQRLLGNNLVQLNDIYVRMQVNKFYLVLCFSICFPGSHFHSYSLLHFLGESGKANPSSLLHFVQLWLP